MCLSEGLSTSREGLELEVSSQASLACKVC